jgi:hypothetical protein
MDPSGRHGAWQGVDSPRRRRTARTWFRSGYAATNLQSAGPKADGVTLLTRFGDLGTRFFAQSDAMGALPSLRAATDPDAQGGQFYGPTGFLGQRGYPDRVSYSSAGHDLAAAQRLWTESERLTGVPVDLGAPR